MSNIKAVPASLKVHQLLSANTIGEDWICSDIHGHLPLLQELLGASGFNSDSDRLILLGDLVDRGPNSLETIHWVLETPWCYSVLGNHELLFWAAVHDPSLSKKRRSLGGEWADSLSNETLQNLAAAIQLQLPLTYSLPCDSGLIGIAHSQSPFADWGALIRAEFSESLAKRCTWDWSRTHQHSAR